MKLVKPGNPHIAEFAKKFSGKRSFSISDLASPTVNGQRYCKWCGKVPVYGSQKMYCGEDCKFSTMVFCYPQTFPATRILLERQDFKCASCSFSYLEYIEQAIESLEKVRADVCWELDFEWICKTANKHVPEERYPETDHIKAVSNGGDTFGLANVEVKCRSCHKSKTAEENRQRNKAQNNYSGTRSTFKKVRNMHD